MKTKRKVNVESTPSKKKSTQRAKAAVCAVAVTAAQVMAKAESSPCDVFLPGIHWSW